MSFIVANSKNEQPANNYTVYFKNEIVIEPNSSIGLYNSQINITPAVNVLEDVNDSYAIDLYYRYSGLKPKADGVDIDDYNINKFVDAQTHLNYLIKIPSGNYDQEDFATQIYYQSTFGDKGGLNSYSAKVDRDANGVFMGYQYIVERQTQTNNLVNMTNVATHLSKLDGGVDTVSKTVSSTTPADNNILTIIKDQAGAVDNEWDSDYQFNSAINYSQIEFSPTKATTDEYFFGLTRNINSDEGIQQNFNDENTNIVIPQDLKENRTAILDISDDQFVGAFMDYACLVVGGDIHLLYLESINGVSRMVELRYWETGTGVGAIQQITDITTPPIIRFTVDGDRVSVDIKINADVDFTTICNGYEWKGRTNATGSLYPRLSLYKLNSELVITMPTSVSYDGFIEPQGALNSNDQQMSNTNQDNLKDFMPDNFYKLGLLNWDYNIDNSNYLVNGFDTLPNKVIYLEEMSCLKLTAIINIGFNHVPANANFSGNYFSSESVAQKHLVAGSLQNTLERNYYPYYTARQGETDIYYNPLNSVITNFQSTNTISRLLTFPDMDEYHSWITSGTTPAVVSFKVSSDSTPTNINPLNCYLRLNNLPVQTYNGGNHSLSRIIGVIPRFNPNRSVGYIYNVYNPVVYCKLNNVEKMTLSQLSLSIVDEDEKLVKDISGKTQIMLHINK